MGLVLLTQGTRILPQHSKELNQSAERPPGPRERTPVKVRRTGPCVHSAALKGVMCCSVHFSVPRHHQEQPLCTAEGGWPRDRKSFPVRPPKHRDTAEQAGLTFRQVKGGCWVVARPRPGTNSFVTASCVIQC